MLTTPDRLLALPSVQVMMNSPDCVTLHKRLENSQDGRESYLRMHALSMVISGQQIVRDESGGRLQISDGDIGVIPRGIHTITDLVAEKGGFEALIVFLSPEEIGRLIPSALIDPGVGSSTGFCHWKIPDTARNWSSDLIEINKKYHNSARELYPIKIAELLTTLALEDPARANQLLNLGQPLSPNLHQFMEIHFDKPFTIQDYAYLSGRSESTFRREFKQRFGRAPLAWIRQKRLEKAQKILSASNQTVSEVSQLVGYDSVSHFIEAYKKQFGVTPGSIR